MEFTSGMTFTGGMTLVEPSGGGGGAQRAIFGYGTTSGSAASRVSITNLVSDTGVMANDTTGVGTARYQLAAANYGGDKAMFAFGFLYEITINLVSNTGVVASDTTATGTARTNLAGAGY
jgi:hypothetical protein